MKITITLQNGFYHLIINGYTLASTSSADQARSLYAKYQAIIKEI